jgi:hypothetical protein
MPEDRISEADSENQPRLKRGRPRKWINTTTNEPYAYEDQRKSFPQVLSERGLNNRFYQERGTVALLQAITPDTEDRFKWLIGTVELQDGKPRVIPGLVSDNIIAKILPAIAEAKRRSVKASILTELGRIAEEGYADSHQHAIEWADALCQAEPKLTVKEACRRLREWRLNRDPKPANEDELVGVIAEAIDAYFDRHAATKEETAKLIDEALWRVMGWYEWVFEEDEILEADSKKKEAAPC